MVTARSTMRPRQIVLTRWVARHLRSTSTLKDAPPGTPVGRQNN
jgi:hypothetical protein